MSNPFGFDLDQVPDTLPTQNLGAGTYKFLIEEIVFAQKPKGGARVVLEKPTASPDMTIEFHCLLAAAANGFAEGWKHTLFFRPFMESDIGQKIAQHQIKKIVEATGQSNNFNSYNQLIGKMFMCTLEPQKSNPEYMNVKTIEAVGGPLLQPTKAKSVGVPNTNEETTPKTTSKHVPSWE